MDQNRCLLDVIDNPQLLQSFLESETSAETTNNNNNNNININDNNHEAGTVTSNNSSTNVAIAPDRSHTASTTTVTIVPSLDNSNSGTTNRASGNDQGPIEPSCNQDNTDYGADSTLPIAEKNNQPSLNEDQLFMGGEGGDGSIIDPVVSVLDSIITETVAEASPSSAHQETAVTEDVALGDSEIAVHHVPNAKGPLTSYSNNDGAPSSLSPYREAVGPSSPALDSTLTYHNVGTGSLADVNDANNNSTSSSDNGSNDLLVDEFYSQHLQQSSGQAQQQDSTHFQHPDQTVTSERNDGPANPIPPEDVATTALEREEIKPKGETLANQQPRPEDNQQFQQQPSVQNTQQFTAQPQEQPPYIQQTQQQHEPQLTNQSTVEAHNQQQSTQAPAQQTPQIQQSPPIAQQSQQLSQPVPQTAQQQQQAPTSSVDTSATQSPSTAPKSGKNQKATKADIKNGAAKAAPENKPKRAPRPKKNAKTTTAPVNPTQTTTTTSSMMKPMQTQFATTSQGQQQIIFQNNNGIRQPAMLAPTSMAQPMGGMPQPQRVIQIQTANGPMYFAIAPGTTTAPGSGIPMNQQQQGQQPQPGMQSQQYPSQQICFQPGTNVLINRPQLNQNLSQQQRQQMSPHQPQPMLQQHPQQMGMQQSHMQLQNQAQIGNNVIVSGHQMMQPSHQQRLASPVVPGQTIAIANQQGQQQHVMLPSSQPMMMPRMPNQMIMNRPLGGPGQPLPGQQQFIQILTPNGPMLLALPQQSQQQQQQPNNNAMIDYNNQVQSGQTSRQMQSPHQQQKGLDTPDSSKSGGASSAKNAANSKSGLDLADLLLDCGILPDDRAASQSSSSIKSSQSPSLSQISSPMPPSLPQTNSPMPAVESTSFSACHPQPQQHTMPSYGQYQGQPIRITMGPDGQMIMQPAVYGAVRPVMAGGIAQPPQLNTMSPNSVIPSSNSVMTMTSSNPSTPKPASTDSPSTTDNKKPAAKGKTTAVKRSRSKKSDIDKFPQLKTPKIAQQQQQQQQQQPQAVVVPMTFLMGDQSKVLAGSPDVKPNISQLGGGQQVSIAKFVSPGMQPTQIQSPLGSNMLQTGVSQHTNTLTTSQMQVVNSGQMNTQIITNSGNSINISGMPQQQQTTTQGMMMNSNAQHSAASSQMSSSDNLKIEQNGLNTTNTGQTTTTQNFKGQIIHSVGGLTTTLVLHPAQAQQRHSITIPNQAQLQQQQLARQKELRVQSILNQLKADQNAALNPQTKQSFGSLEDACKRLLRYHVFDTEIIGEEKINEVDDIFEAAVESLLARKQAIYDKFRFLILKQSMKTVPMSEEVMLEQVFVNDELAYLKKERELFREYEAHLDSMALKQSRDDTKSDECGPDYFAFGGINSPKQDIQNDQDNASRSRDVEDWLLPNKWADSRYSSVPDSEAATAIESILNEDIS